VSNLPQFKTVSAWSVLGLSLVTLGAYPVYWLWSRTQTLNPHTEQPISEDLIWCTAGTYFLAIVLVVSAVLIGDSYAITLLAFSMLVMALLLLAIVGGKWRNRWVQAVPQGRGNVLLAMLCFFQVVYLQHRINVAQTAVPTAC